MNRPCIGCARKDAVKGIDFPHQVALAQAADCRVAAHCTDRRRIKRDQRRARAHARRNAGRFDPGVSAANHDDIKGLHHARRLPH